MESSMRVNTSSNVVQRVNPISNSNLQQSAQLEKLIQLEQKDWSEFQ